VIIDGFGFGKPFVRGTEIDKTAVPIIESVLDVIHLPGVKPDDTACFVDRPAKRIGAAAAKKSEPARESTVFIGV
jgi:hypothetical protein